jgi:hypothetical protein
MEEEIEAIEVDEIDEEVIEYLSFPYNLILIHKN